MHEAFGLISVAYRASHGVATLLPVTVKEWSKMMSWQNDEVQYIPYQQAGKPRRRAAIARVAVDLKDIDDDTLQVLGHLVEAADAMNPIFRDQFEPRTFPIRRLVLDLIDVAQEAEQRQLQDYLAILDLQNSPYALLPRQNHLLEIPVNRLKALARKAGPDTAAALKSLLSLLTQEHTAPEKANFYPHDLSDEEFAGLASAAGIVNSSVVRDARGRPTVVLNEKRYRRSLQRAIEHLGSARDLVQDVDFRLHLDAKLLELETGSEEARRLSDVTWIRHDNPVDIVISTAIEVYLDEYKNIRGAAAGGVYLRNRQAEDLLAAIVQRVPKLEAQAPWTHKKTVVDPSTLPRLRFVDVLTWAGDYVSAPGTTIAQSLPNDEWVRQNVGSVNMVYVNTGQAVQRISGHLWAEEFLLPHELARVKGLLYEANQLHSALHEIGHSAGRMDEAHRQGQPSDYLQEELSFLEELRAELFGLWAMRLLVDDGILSPEVEQAAHDDLLLAMLTDLKFEPVQAHNKARNAMFHAFEAEGLIRRNQEQGKTRFSIRFEAAPKIVAELLRTVADLRSAGDKPGTIALRERLVFVDPLKSEIERRTADFPLGRGLVFPRLAKEDGRYLRQLVYPEEFSAQPKFSYTIGPS